MKSDIYKIGMVGSPCVGKTSLIIKYLFNCFDTEYQPTIEDAYRGAVMIDRKQYSINIVDCGDLMSDQIIKQMDGFMCIYSINADHTLDDLKRKIIHIRKIRNDPSTPLIIIGNKNDLVYQRSVFTRDGISFANNYETEYIETSAIQGYNIGYIFVQLVRRILLHKCHRK